MMDSNNVRYKLVSISDEKTANNLEGIVSGQLSEETLKFQYRIETVVKTEDNLIVVVPSVRYLLNDSVIFKSSVRLSYSVAPIDTVIDVDRVNKRLNLKVDIIPTLLVCSYNTLRGIVYSHTLSTPLEKFPIPLVGVVELLEKNGISVED
ncbi:MAG: hypothetical protein J5771_03750 [Bacteroidales bacterium]|nr:hypothetical protein [Bacteroidales bacterium]